MATDATGTPTPNFGIPTFNPSVDAPSGLGFNAAMEFIDGLFANVPQKPAGIAAGEAAVWNGTGWARSSVTRLGQSSLGSGAADFTKLLSGDGTWQKKGIQLLWDSVNAGVTLPAASITTPTLDSSFAHLLVVYEASANIAGIPVLGMRINGDALGHYYGQRTTSNNAAVAATVYTAGTALQVGLLGGTTNTNYRGGGFFLIPCYRQSGIAVPVTGVSSAFSGTGSSLFWTGQFSGMKGDTSAVVDTLTFLETGGNNILASSRFSVYGIGGS